jgi:hypothetical protein
LKKPERISENKRVSPEVFSPWKYEKNISTKKLPKK